MDAILRVDADHFIRRIAEGEKFTWDLPKLDGNPNAWVGRTAMILPVEKIIIEAHLSGPPISGTIQPVGVKEIIQRVKFSIPPEMKNQFVTVVIPND